MGVAQTMIKAALDLVKAEASEARKMVFLELYTNNVAAKTLYIKWDLWRRRTARASKRGTHA